METFKNAKAVIEQIRNGEWEFKYSGLMERHHHAEREGRELWVSNGGWFCERSVIYSDIMFGGLLQERQLRKPIKSILS